MSSDNLPRLLTIPEAVEAIGNTICEATLRKEIREGRLPIRRIGRAVRILDSDLRAWVLGDRGRNPSGAERR